MRLSSIARAIWSQDAKLANLLIENSELGHEFIAVVNGEVSCKNLPRFENLFIQAKQEHFESEGTILYNEATLDDSESVGAEHRSMRRTSKLNALNRLAALWTPKSPRLALSGVLITEDMLQKYGFVNLNRNEKGTLLRLQENDKGNLCDYKRTRVGNS